MTTKPQNGKASFKTTDLYYAAYLQVSGAALQKTEREPGGKVSFCFDGSVVNIDELQDAWFKHTGRVPALPYANAIKSLKSVCHMI